MSDSMMKGLGEGLLAGTLITNVGSAGNRVAQIEVLLKQVEEAEDRVAKAEKRARKAEDENEMLKERIELLERQQAQQADIGILIANSPASSRVKEEIEREIAMAHEMIDLKLALRKKEEELRIKEQEFLEFFAANGGLKIFIRKKIAEGTMTEQEARSGIDQSIAEFSDQQGTKLENTTTVKAAKERMATGAFKPV